MCDASSPFPKLRLAIAPGVPSPHLSALLALQRTEEPGVSIAFFEVTSDELISGLHEGIYDAGLSLQAVDDPSPICRSLWSENVVLAMPLRSSLLDQAKLTISDLQDHPLFCWKPEACPILEQRLSALAPAGKQSVQYVASFEIMALWISSGYGIGISRQSRIERAHGWGITMRPLADGPYETGTYLQRPHGQAGSVAERFEQRVLRYVDRQRQGRPGSTSTPF